MIPKVLFEGVTEVETSTKCHVDVIRKCLHDNFNVVAKTALNTGVTSIQIEVQTYSIFLAGDHNLLTSAKNLF